MPNVKSFDGTRIAFSEAGHGPTLVMVSGATQYRAADSESPEMLDALAPHFKVIQYDRRGRGESGDTPPYALEREIEDIQALIDHAGSPAFLYGHSSGAALTMQAALALGSSVKKLALYEPPFNDDPQARQIFVEYRCHLQAALDAGNYAEAVKLFMQVVGVPQAQIAGMQQSPAWEPLEHIAPTLAYDAAALGEDAAIPTRLAAQIRVPTLVMDGEQSLPFMHQTATTLAEAISGAQHCTLAGQDHGVKAAALAPVLSEFFLVSSGNDQQRMTQGEKS